MGKERHDIVLTEVIRGFLEYANEKGKKRFVPLYNWRWHKLFFVLQKNYSTAFPVLEYAGSFSCDEFDSPYSETLNEILHGLIYAISVSLVDEHYVSLDMGRKLVKNYLVSDCPELAEKMFKTAVSIQGFFKD